MVPTDKAAYTHFSEKKLVPDYYEGFHASIYSLENSFPLVKLGQVDRWPPDPANRSLAVDGDSIFIRCLIQLVSPPFLRWSRWVQVLLGWFLATMWIAGVTGLVRMDCYLCRKTYARSLVPSTACVRLTIPAPWFGAKVRFRCSQQLNGSTRRPDCHGLGTAGAIPASRTRLWLASGWGCRGRRLSRG